VEMRRGKNFPHFKLVVCTNKEGWVTKLGKSIFNNFKVAQQKL